MTSGEPLVELAGARLVFPGRPPVLECLDLAVPAGAFHSLLGPSGCGKSTVLRVMAGLQPLSAGVVRSRAQAPAFVFQEPALMPWATVADNVGLPLRVAGVRTAERQAQVHEVLGRVGLQAQGPALPHELSGGMKMRASIARALVTRPDLLLMDEPFAALDDPTRHRLQDDLSAWWRSSGFGVCFVTHQVAEAVYLSTSVAVMDAAGGGIQARFTIDEPFPRGESFRRSTRFHETCVAVADAMRQAEADRGTR